MTDWVSGVELGRVLEAVRTARDSGRLHDVHAVVFHDLDLMTRRIAELSRRFPAGALHAVAIKANPLVEVLRVAVAAGAGLEAASLEEVHVALAAGCPPSRIVFDSPAKTRAELSEATRLGVMLNADSFDELGRIAALPDQAGESTVGLRINPMVGAGSIGITSVAARGSKFGVALDDARDAIIDAFGRYPWLVGLHVHVGSQGCPLDQLVEAGVRVQALREAIDQRHGAGRVRYVDIGGGLPVAYLDDDEPPSLAAYVARLRDEAGRLLDGDVALVTEFGRAVQAGCGFALSRVEYVKRPGGRRTAVTHLGADFLMRAVYQPEHWRHRYLALDAACEPKQGPERPWSLAGPLCFSGDVIEREAALPELEPGDWILIRDVGAYTLSMWSRHCSRGMPLVLACRGDPVSLDLLRARERPEDVARFWTAAGAGGTR